MRWRVGLLAGLAVAGAAAMFVLPPAAQDRRYHEFAAHSNIWGVPNFWNVVSNFAFLFAAAWGARTLRNSAAFKERWEHHAYAVLIAGVFLVSFGSAYYHLHPSDETLVWDRLPMTLVFMSLLTTTIGERIDGRAGRLLLLPLLALGLGSVVYWKLTGDVRIYGLVQYYPMAALPLMAVLFPPRYAGPSGMLGLVGLYAVAKIFETIDRQIGAVLATGGHPWKHVAASAALLCYLSAVAHRGREGAATRV